MKLKNEKEKQNACLFAEVSVNFSVCDFKRCLMTLKAMCI